MSFDQVVEFLIGKGASLESTTVEGHTSLFIAACYAQVKIIQHGVGIYLF